MATYTMPEDMREKLAKEIDAEFSKARTLLNPRAWNKEISDLWHKKLPDMQAAFDAIRGVL